MSSTLLAVTTNLGTFNPPSAIVAPSDLTSKAAVTSKLESVISQFLGVVTVVAGIFLIFYFVTGALNWITAAGDTGKIEKARSAMIQSVSGMVLVVAAYGVIGIIGNFLGISILNPAQALMSIIP